MMRTKTKLDSRERKVVAAIRRAIRDDKTGEYLAWSQKCQNPYAGYCYVASEAFVTLIRRKGYKPMHLSHKKAQLKLTIGSYDYNSDHWFIQAPDGRIIDPTSDQFAKTPEYHLAKGKGFLTKKPSKRGAALIRVARRYAQP